MRARIAAWEGQGMRMWCECVQGERFTDFAEVNLKQRAIKMNITSHARLFCASSCENNWFHMQNRSCLQNFSLGHRKLKDIQSGMLHMNMVLTCHWVPFSPGLHLLKG